MNDRHFLYRFLENVITYLQKTGQYEIIQEIESVCIFPKDSSIAHTWLLLAMFKTGLIDLKVIADIEISKMQQRIQTKNMKSLQVCNSVNSLKFNL